MEEYVNYYEMYTSPEEKKEPQTFHEKISEILYRYDPAGLAELYLPEDEYDSESGAIIRKLSGIGSVGVLKWVVYDVFEDYFGVHGTLIKGHHTYGLIAEEIWDIWQDEIRKRI